ncbi:YrdB family protein [Kitasatospora sp. NPDC054939]
MTRPTPGTAALSTALLVLFGIELFTFAELAWWGSTFATTPVIRALAALAALAVATGLWATFAAPRARIRVPALSAAVKTLVYGTAATTLADDHPMWAGAFLGVLVLTTAAVRLLDHHPTPLRPKA